MRQQERLGHQGHPTPNHSPHLLDLLEQHAISHELDPGLIGGVAFVADLVGDHAGSGKAQASMRALPRNAWDVGAGDSPQDAPAAFPSAGNQCVCVGQSSP